jgi:hypothetical protein
VLVAHEVCYAIRVEDHTQTRGSVPRPRPVDFSQRSSYRVAGGVSFLPLRAAGEKTSPQQDGESGNFYE